MCKFTTIILLCCIFLINTINVSSQNADINILRYVNKSESAGLKHYSTFISNTTKITALTVPLVLGSIALIEKNDDLLKNAIYVGVSVGVTTGISYGLKYTVMRKRPYITYPDLNVDPANYETSSSFPSAHTSVAFATATALSLKYPKWYVIAPSYFWACSVGYSRLNLGVHYPTDVLTGVFLGAGSAFITYKINDWFWKKQNNKKLIGLNAYL